MSPEIRQSDLFDAAPPSPEGLRYQPAVVPPGEQAVLATRLAALPFRPFEFHGYTGNRRIVSYGVRYDYTREAVAPSEPLPDFLEPLRLLAGEIADLDPKLFGQALVTEYAPGAGIGWHRDKAVFGEVVGFSFGSEASLRFRRRRPSGGWDRFSQKVEPGSVYLMTGPSRTIWEHSIVPGDCLRFSVTFRRYVAPASSRPSEAAAGGG